MTLTACAMPSPQVWKAVRRCGAKSIDYVLQPWGGSADAL